MKVYKPVFTNHWSIEELDTEDLRIVGRDTIVSKWGTIYNNNFYRTKEAAQKYISKEYWTAEQDRVRVHGHDNVNL